LEPADLENFPGSHAWQTFELFDAMMLEARPATQLSHAPNDVVFNEYLPVGQAEQRISPPEYLPNGQDVQ